MAGAWESVRAPSRSCAAPPGRKQQCAGKSAITVTDPRQIDLLAIVALVLLAATFYFSDRTVPSNNTALIEPSQNVRW